MTVTPTKTNARLHFWLLTIFAVAGLGFAATMPLCRILSASVITQKVAADGDASRVYEGELCTQAGCEPALLFQGGISGRSMARLTKALDAAPDTKLLCLSSNGGDTEEGRDMAQVLRARGIKTCVAPREILGLPTNDRTAPKPRYMPTECGSSCSHLWLGGAERVLADKGASVGFHQAYAGEACYCLLDNLVQAGKWHWGNMRDKQSLNDAVARDALQAKAANCGPSEFYRLRAPEAMQLGLVNAANAGSRYWRPINPAVAIPALPDAAECSGKPA